MKFAVIGDIHSNLYALQSVVQDIQTRGIEKTYCTGDLVGYLTDPNGVIEYIQSHKILTIQGNHDLKIVQSDKTGEDVLNSLSEQELQNSASFHHNNETISDINRLFLAQLKQEMVLNIEGFSIQIIHGSPDSISEYMYEDDEKLTTFALTSIHDVIIYGHTHVPYHKVIEGVHFINPGSVGKPKHGNHKSTYMIVEVIESELKTELVEVSYDIITLINDIKENPWISNNLIEDLLQGGSLENIED